jgi:hypothetical protein
VGANVPRGFQSSAGAEHDEVHAVGYAMAVIEHDGVGEDENQTALMAAAVRRCDDAHPPSERERPLLRRQRSQQSDHRHCCEYGDS